MEKFNYETNGYNRGEVNDFINNVIVQTEVIVKKCQAQQQKIERLTKELEHYRKMEDMLKTSIVKAEESADNIKKLARDEANLVVNDAKNNASRIVNDALLRAEKIEFRKDTLESNMKIFKRKLKLIMRQQIEVVNEIETLELVDDNIKCDDGVESKSSKTNKDSSE